MHGYQAAVSVMRMVGIVKKKSLNTGRHFVSCQDISDVYGRDAQIPLEEMLPDLGFGDRISFEVDEPGEGFSGTLCARNIKKLGVETSNRRKGRDEMGDGEDEEFSGDDNAAAEEEEPEESTEQAAWQDEGEELEEVAEPEARPASRDEQDLDSELQTLSDTLGELVAAEREEISALTRSAMTKLAASAPTEDPDTTQGWIKHQDTIFAGLPKLPKDWIRIRSKSKGLVYFYNTRLGKSSGEEPTE